MTVLGGPAKRRPTRLAILRLDVGALLEQQLDDGLAPVLGGKSTTICNLEVMRYTPMRCTPVRCTPKRCTPVRSTPMRYTPKRCTPMRCTPMRYTPVGCTLERFWGKPPDLPPYKRWCGDRFVKV